MRLGEFIIFSFDNDDRYTLKAQHIIYLDAAKS